MMDRLDMRVGVKHCWRSRRIGEIGGVEAIVQVGIRCAEQSSFGQQSQRIRKVGIRLV